jgi:hypothetical protein
MRELLSRSIYLPLQPIKSLYSHYSWNVVSEVVKVEFCHVVGVACFGFASGTMLSTRELACTSDRVG